MSTMSLASRLTFNPKGPRSQGRDSREIELTDNQLQNRNLRDVVFRGESMRAPPPQEPDSELCSFCSGIPLSPTGDVDSFKSQTMFMSRMIENRNGKCKLCTLLFRAVCKHDPFQHPAIKDHLPEKFKGKTFKDWANSDYRYLNSRNPLGADSWPFGSRRDAVKVNMDQESERMEVERGRNTAEDGAFYGAVGGTVALTAVQGQVHDPKAARWMGTAGSLLPALSARISQSDKRLPVIIKITPLQPRVQGEQILHVSMYAFGGRFAAPLNVVSSFPLRVMPALDSIADNQCVYARRLENSINLADCKLWMECCVDHHGSRCNNSVWPASKRWPDGLRLICTQEERLVELSDIRLEDRKYAAMSYVWGEPEEEDLFKLTSSNLHELRQRKRLWLEDNYRYGKNTQASKPQPPPMRMIQDAMRVTRQLGIRYLWVDSLCIVQEGDDDHDKNIQLAQMDRIYGCATITLVSSHGKDATVPLPGVLATRRMTDDTQIFETMNKKHVMLPVEYHTDLGPWASRAWTMQEMLLSQRLLIFGSQYVSFHCRMGTMREDMPADPAKGIHAPRIPWMKYNGKPDPELQGGAKALWDGSFRLLRTSLFNEYTNVISEYTSRNMKKAQDGINAVQGLLKALDAPEATSASGYLQGLPLKYLDSALLWQPPPSRRSRIVPRHGGKISFSSWSWAGWKPVDDGLGIVRVDRHGIRYEPGFRVFTDNRGILKKVQDMSPQAEERIKPCIHWFVVRPEGQRQPPATPVSTSLSYTESIKPTPPPVSSRSPKPGPPVPPRSPGLQPPLPPRNTSTPSPALPLRNPPKSSPTLRPSVSASSSNQSASSSNQSASSSNQSASSQLEVPPSTTPKQKGPDPPAPRQRSQSNQRQHLVPINGHGMGICLSEGEEATNWFLKQPLIPSSPTPIIGNLTLEPDLHLICVTQVATLSIGPLHTREEKAWKLGQATDSKGSQEMESTVLELTEAAIYGDLSNRNSVGRNGDHAVSSSWRDPAAAAAGWVIPTTTTTTTTSTSSTTPPPARNSFTTTTTTTISRALRAPAPTPRKSTSSFSFPTRGEFIILSESQYLGDEDRVDVAGFPYYNVMLIERVADDNNINTNNSGGSPLLCKRLGLGKIRKDIWRRLEGVRVETVVLC